MTVKRQLWLPLPSCVCLSEMFVTADVNHRLVVELHRLDQTASSSCTMYATHLWHLHMSFGMCCSMAAHSTDKCLRWCVYLNVAAMNAAMHAASNRTAPVPIVWKEWRPNQDAHWSTLSYSETVPPWNKWWVISVSEVFVCSTPALLHSWWFCTSCKTCKLQTQSETWGQLLLQA